MNCPGHFVMFDARVRSYKVGLQRWIGARGIAEDDGRMENSKQHGVFSPWNIWEHHPVSVQVVDFPLQMFASGIVYVF